ncbi:MAG: thymidylate synthase [Candidatus Diapherotrites archaeon CG10_big_fil_rev_8_21_14_0_10_31_34]|nr:MAG: thymidylate synthase [Candidatus Diapherotrites archaeon CG10_big_fil_rev_8_21_14_0_10_31_34]
MTFTMKENLSEEQKQILSPFVSSTENNVFVLKNLPEVVMGALFSRYSRSPKSLRQLLLDEFILDEKYGFEQIVGYQKGKGIEQALAIKKAEEFYDRILLGYGDDSVAELGGAHIAVEDISNIAVKLVQDSRLGISPLEKSTRYVYFDEKDEKGNYNYLRPKEITESNFSEDYTDLCSELFNVYSKNLEPMKKFIEEKNPQEKDVSDRAYNSTVKAKACDVLRVFLPASTLTNTGLYGNGRAFEYLISRLSSYPLHETKVIGKKIHSQLQTYIPSFVKRAFSEYGEQQINFLSDTREKVNNLTKEILAEEQIKELKEKSEEKESNEILKEEKNKTEKAEQKPIELTKKEVSENSDEVQLIDFDSEAENKILSAIIYSNSHLPLQQIKEKIKNLNEEEKKKIINSYSDLRTNRRHKPGRAFENAFYTFDILGNYGIFRDLHRHRILTQERQLLSTHHGFVSPIEFDSIGIKEEYISLMKQAKNLFDLMEEKMPWQAQYCVPFGYKIRWYMKLNLREAFHLTELRSSVQGHPDYRRIAQKMFSEIKKVHPSLVEQLKFVDLKEYKLERLEAEKAQDKKIKEIEEKYNK